MLNISVTSRLIIFWSSVSSTLAFFIQSDADSICGWILATIFSASISEMICACSITVGMRSRNSPMTTKINATNTRLDFSQFGISQFFIFTLLSNVIRGRAKKAIIAAAKK